MEHTVVNDHETESFWELVNQMVRVYISHDGLEDTFSYTF
jgi:hypothetical protein